MESEMDVRVSDTGLWKQYLPGNRFAEALGINNTSFQSYELMNPGGSVTERSMLTIYELSLLYMLAKDYYSGEGVIVDLGPLLGVSTNALARGLDKNKAIINKDKSIFAFDLFLSRDMGTVITEPTETGSIFSRFLRNNIDYLKYLSISPGNLLEMDWRKRKIEVLFIDIAKSWTLNEFVVENFFCCLIPQKSIVVQQDYVHFNEYWIHITMEYFKDYFELLYMVNGSSAVYLYKSEIPNDILYNKIRHFTLDQKLKLLERARIDKLPSVQQVMKCAHAYCLIEHERYDDAYNLLGSIDIHAGATNAGEDPSVDFSQVLLSNANIVNDLLKQKYGKGIPAITHADGLLDSGQRDNLIGNIVVSLDKTEVSSKENIKGIVKITNTGSTHWQISAMPVGTVNLGTHLLSADGENIIERDFPRHSISANDKNTAAGRKCVIPHRNPISTLR